MLTQAEIEAIRKRAEAATEGPWYTAHTTDGPWIIEENGDIISGTCSQIEDGSFIAEARTDIPKLLAEIERLHKEVDEAVRSMEKSDVEKEYWRMEREHERRQAEMYRKKYLRSMREKDRLKEYLVIAEQFRDDPKEISKIIAEALTGGDE